MGKGSNTTQSTSSGTSTTSPDSNAYQAYLALLNRASGVAATPYQGYGGEEVAPINGQQTAGIGTINQTVANTQPLSASDIQKYQDPYTNEVIGATQRDFDVQNQRANSTVTGNAAAQGALGGDRVAVAQALTQEAQNRTQAPVIAGLRSQGYQNAVHTAQDQQKFGFQAGLQGGQAQIGAGTLEQQTQQAQDTQSRADYYQQQGYPFQVAQWLASIDTGVGSHMGGTSTSNQSGTTQGPTPNPWTQAVGLGLSAASIFANRGGRISGVGRRGYAGGGSPYGNDQSWVPQANIGMGKDGPAPPQTHAPDAPKQQQSGLSSSQMKGLGALGTGAKNWWDTGESDVSMSDVMSARGITSADIELRRGGRVRRYAGGGFADEEPTSFEDRFDASYPNKKVPTAGIGASAPAFDDVVNPDDPIVLDPEATAEWRSRVDRDNGRKIVQAATTQSAPVPASLATNDNQPGVGPVAAINRAVKAPSEPEEEPSEALAYDRPRAAPRAVAPSAGVAAPSEEDHSFLGSLGIHMTPELRQGLLQAGLSMMATTRGGPGSFLGSLGEAGAAGVGAYSQSQQAARKQALDDLKLKTEMEDRGLKNDSSPLIRGPDGHMVVNPAYVKLKQQEAEISSEPKTPFGWVTDDKGVPHFVPGGPADPDYAKKLAEARAKIPFGWKQDEDGSIVPITGGPADPNYLRSKTEATSKDKPGALLDDATIDDMARQYITGDKSVVQNLGRGAQGAENVVKLRQAIVRVGKEMNLTPEQRAVKMAEFQGMAAGQRSLGTRTAQIEMAANEARNMMQPALDLSEKVARTNWVPVNKAIQAYESGTSDPDLAAWGAANFSLVNTYVRAIAPTGVPPESSREHALKMLNTAMGHDAYKRVIKQMDIEMEAALKSPEQVKEKFRTMYGGAEGEKPIKTELSGADQQALDWAKNNPNDPRAAAIKKKLGVE